MIQKISSRDMSREEWLKERNKSIGGSDAGSVLGLNPYKSRYTLWSEKTGKIVPEDISEKEAVRLGHDLEEYVAQRFTEATGKAVRRSNYIWRNDAYPFAHADLDRVIIGEKAGLECKTTSSWEILRDCKDGRFPDTWYCQITHYMMVTGYDVWYLGVLCLGSGFFWFKIERDDDEIMALAHIEKRFWDCVTEDRNPGIDGKEDTLDTLKMIYKESTDKDLNLSAYELELGRYRMLKEEIEEKEKQLTEITAELMGYMGDAERGRIELDDSVVTVSWKTQRRKTFDRKKFEAENGKIPDEYFTESISRPFKVAFKKRSK